MSDASETPETGPVVPDDKSAATSSESSSGSSGTLSRRRLAAIGGGLGAFGLVLGLFIGWFAFDDGGSGGDRNNGRGRMSQQQGPARDHKEGGPMKRGRLDGGQMMPGDGDQQLPPAGADQGVPTTPSTELPSTSSSVVPQSLQQS
jgi:hypothetical protein